MLPIDVVTVKSIVDVSIVLVIEVDNDESVSMYCVVIMVDALS